MVRKENTKSGLKARKAGRAGSGLILAALAFGLMGQPAWAAEDPLLSRMTGDFVGRGTFKSSPSAEPEMVYCKITNALASGGTVLTQKGRCAVATNSGRVTGTMEAKGGGVYQGTLESLSTKGPVKFAGKASGDQITMNADFVDKRSSKPGKAVIQTVVGDGKYRTVSRTVDTKTKSEFVASDIVFTKQ
ncbi:hypothetical protein [Bauldia litoralis]|nr:hypothetical protein [Bauldia litoralis]